MSEGGNMSPQQRDVVDVQIVEYINSYGVWKLGNGYWYDYKSAESERLAAGEQNQNIRPQMHPI